MRTPTAISAAMLAVFCLAAPLFAQTPTPQTPTPQTPATPQTQTPMPAQTPATTAPTTQMPTSVIPPASGQPVGTSGTTSIADTEHGTEILLLERVQKVLDNAADGKAGAVTIDRGLLDELRAEVSQVKASLQGEKK